MASLASFKVQWDFILGQRSRANVISGTEQTVNELHSTVRDADRKASRQREGEFQGHLGKLEGISRKSGENLLQQKRDIAKKSAQGYQAGQKSRAQAAAGGAGAKASTVANNLKKVTQAGEQAFKMMKKRRKEMGMGAGAATFAKDIERFSQLRTKAQKAELLADKKSIEVQDKKIKGLKEEYELIKSSGGFKKGGSHYGKSGTLLAEIRKEQRVKEEMVEIERTKNDVMKDGKILEEAHIDRLQEIERMKGRLIQAQQESKRMEKEVARTREQAYQQFARQIESTTANIGEGLRNAFVYATAAMTAFYYKLNEVNQVVTEFENQLINAQSIWRGSNEDLFELSDQVVQFGNVFGIEMGKATEGLYQYASAGVSAAESMEMLTHTLTLAMAVQGDHNTLAKLTTQTIMGFGLEFSDAAEVTDKFAHAINLSLIEWDDLASSVKFALPFFISTGQSLDQLLGALQVLTNRALEAGIAGRGLRQALAEFTQHAEDNAASFRKLGIEILDLEGNMYPLDQIAQQFNQTLGEGASDMDIMITLMEDLNIRGATAFIHLVQNADEYTAAVNDLKNSSGEAHEMAMIQQQSLTNQVQLLKNALLAPFLLADEVGQAHGYLNEFVMVMHQIVSMFEDLIVTGEEGNKKLTDMGQFMKDFVIVAMKEAAVIIQYTIEIMQKWSSENEAAYGMLSLLTVPLQTLLRIISALGPQMLNTIMMYKVLSKIIPLNIAQTINQIQTEMAHIALMEKDIAIKQIQNALLIKKLEFSMMENVTQEQILARQQVQIEIATLENALTKAGNTDKAVELTLTYQLLAAKIALHAAMFAIVYASGKLAQTNPVIAKGIAAVAGAVMGLAIAFQILKAMPTGWSLVGALAAGAVAAVGFQHMMSGLMQVPDIEGLPTIGTDPFATSGNVIQADLGGRMSPRYAMGGRVGGDGSHFPVMVEAGETIISKTQNMARGTGGADGITINISGDVYDGDNFAQKIGQALPNALRGVTDIGGM